MKLESPIGPTSRWPLQDAKARFSELVRRAQSDGPQHVTVHGRETVVILSSDDFRRLKPPTTGQALIDVLQTSPYPEIDLAPVSIRGPVRDIDL